MEDLDQSHESSLQFARDDDGDKLVFVLFVVFSFMKVLSASVKKKRKKNLIDRAAAELRQPTAAAHKNVYRLLIFDQSDVRM